MPRRYLNLDYLEKSSHYLGDVEDHPHVELIETLLNGIGICAAAIRTESKDTISWHHFKEPRLPFWITVHRDYRKQITVGMAVAVAAIPVEQEAEIALHFMRLNTHLRFPMRYTIHLPCLLSVQFDSVDKFLTKENLVHRFHAIFEFAKRSRAEFKELGLLDLPDSWFEMPKAS